MKLCNRKELLLWRIMILSMVTNSSVTRKRCCLQMNINWTFIWFHLSFFLQIQSLTVSIFWFKTSRASFTRPGLTVYNLSINSILMTPHVKAKEDLFWWFHTDIKQHMGWQLRSDIPHSVTIGSVALSQEYWQELPTQKWNYSRIVPSNLRYHSWQYWMQPVGLHFPYQSQRKPTNKAINAISNLWLRFNPV